MPDCVILNPKMHPDPAYQELCGCGITYVLLRQLGKTFPIEADVWSDILAITGMATICDVVPLNPINHQLARLGVRALIRSQRPVLRQLRQACALSEGLNETDVGFRLGPRINAVGRLEHAEAVVQAFIGQDTVPLIRFMGECNDRRKRLQEQIVKEASQLALQQEKSPILFLGGDWHPGVVGIAASKLVDAFWKPVWLFQRGEALCKGSARSIPGFDVTAAMQAAGDCFLKFGGHRAAAGYSFAPEQEQAILMALVQHAVAQKQQNPELWQSQCRYDCELPLHLLNLDLMDLLDELRPFGHGFEEPRFLIEAPIEEVRFYQDKATGEPKHTAVSLAVPTGRLKLMFFHKVCGDLVDAPVGRFLVTAQRNVYQGRVSLSLFGRDYALQEDYAALPAR
ncbi:MAG: hypothetical protein KDK78_08240 [Chlamydiia bacterium]|nr:hypothetical protein [Chlamydiia bacterium]